MSKPAKFIESGIRSLVGMARRKPLLFASAAVFGVCLFQSPIPSVLSAVAGFAIIRHFEHRSDSVRTQ